MESLGLPRDVSVSALDLFPSSQDSPKDWVTVPGGSTMFDQCLPRNNKKRPLVCFVSIVLLVQFGSGSLQNIW